MILLLKKKKNPRLNSFFSLVFFPIFFLTRSRDAIPRSRLNVILYNMSWASHLRCRRCVIRVIREFQIPKLFGIISRTRVFLLLVQPRASITVHRFYAHRFFFYIYKINLLIIIYYKKNYRAFFIIFSIQCSRVISGKAQKPSKVHRHDVYKHWCSQRSFLRCV